MTENNGQKIFLRFMWYVSQLLHSLCVEALYASRWDQTGMYVAPYYTTSGYNLWSFSEHANLGTWS